MQGNCCECGKLMKLYWKGPTTVCEACINKATRLRGEEPSPEYLASKARADIERSKQLTRKKPGRPKL
jgi:hypothetical protein